MAVKIYTLSDPDTNIVKYVGQTHRKSLKQRLNEHIYKSKISSYKISNWIKSLAKNNKYPVIELLDEVPENDWVFWEIYWIEQIKTWGFDLKNTQVGGNAGNLGRKASEETKKKMSISRKNNPNYRKPKGPMSEEGKLKRKEGMIRTFRERLGIDDKLKSELFYKIDIENKSVNKASIELNIPYCRAVAIYKLKIY
jgi:hypothetical protein